jgi:hypothetical protein
MKCFYHAYANKKKCMYNFACDMNRGEQTRVKPTRPFQTAPPCPAPNLIQTVLRTWSTVPFFVSPHGAVRVGHLKKTGDPHRPA